MKRTIHLLAALPAVLLLANGCQQELIDLEEQKALTAEIVDEPSTRTAYDNEYGKFKWTPGDQIVVPYAGNRLETYEMVPTTGNPAVARVLSSIKGMDNRIFYAVYPASAWVAPASWTGSPIVNLKASYDEFAAIIADTSGSLGLDQDFSPVPMVAQNLTRSNVLEFHHVGGLLRINCEDMDPATKTIVVTFDQDVTGNYTVNVDDPTKPYIETAGTATNNQVTFTVASGDVLGTDPTYSFVLNVPVPCGTYQYVKVEAFDKDGNSLLVREYAQNPLTFDRGHGKRISFKELTYSYHIDGDFDDVASDQPGGLGTITVDYASYMEDNEGGQQPIPFEVQYSPDGTDGTWTTTRPDWLMMGDGIDYSGNIPISQQKIKVSLSPLPNLVPTNDYGIPLDEHTNALRNHASPADGTDLSMFDWKTMSTVPRNTANCYIVMAPGVYRIPLVYGNGVKNGSDYDWGFRARRRQRVTDPVTGEYVFNGHNYTYVTNADGTYEYEYIPDAGYNFSVPDIPTQEYPESRLLGRYVDHLDLGISSRWIVKQMKLYHSIEPTNMDCKLVWMDADGLVTNVKYIQGSDTRNYSDYFLEFEVPYEGICQGNAVVAVIADGKIAWSWHIWVTDRDFTETEPTMDEKYPVTKFNLGWVDKRLMEHYEDRHYYIRFKQTVPDGVVTNPVRIDQISGPDVLLGGNCVYYTSGKKDPYPGIDGNMTSPGSKPVYPRRSSNPYYPVYAVPDVVSLGMGIQTPYIQYYGGYTWTTFSIVNGWNATQEMIVDNGANTATSARDAGSRVTKTIYDPSPAGFKVPGSQAYAGMAEIMEDYEVDEVQGPGRAYGDLFFAFMGNRDITFANYGEEGAYYTAGAVFRMQADAESHYLRGERIRITRANATFTSAGSLEYRLMKCTPDLDTN